MITASPAYTFNARHSLSLWYGHVHLLPDHILGQWFCLDRRSGRRLWERRYPKGVVAAGIPYRAD